MLFKTFANLFQSGWWFIPSCSDRCRMSFNLIQQCSRLRYIFGCIKHLDCHYTAIISIIHDQTVSNLIIFLHRNIHEYYGEAVGLWVVYHFHLSAEECCLLQYSIPHPNPHQSNHVSAYPSFLFGKAQWIGYPERLSA